MVKYWHLRAVDPDAAANSNVDIILPTGGLTVAYSVCPAKGVDSIFVNFAKCRNYPCTDKDLFARRDAAMDAVLLDFKNSMRQDAAKLAEVRKKFLTASIRRVHTSERFCYKRGREEAAKRLHDAGPADILTLDHPISVSIADWVANTLWPLGADAAGYKGDDMGFNIDIWIDDHGRWVSDMMPSEGYVVEGYEDCH